MPVGGAWGLTDEVGDAALGDACVLPEEFGNAEGMGDLMFRTGVAIFRTFVVLAGGGGLETGLNVVPGGLPEGFTDAGAPEVVVELAEEVLSSGRGVTGRNDLLDGGT